MSTAQSSDSIEAAIAQTLERIGFSELRPKQKLAVRTFVEGNDVFVCLPTGSGKSLCYWLLPRVFEAIRQGVNSTVIVVSPLEALMKDQEHSLQLRGIRATKLGLSDTDHEKMESIKQCYYEVVFVSPERLLTDSEMRDMLHSPLYKEHLVGVVIDEAHCVKKWLARLFLYYVNFNSHR